MNFKKSKQEVITDANIAAMNRVSAELSSYNYSQINSVQHTIERAITSGIEAAIRSLVDNIYTNDDFEKDLKL